MRRSLCLAAVGGLLLCNASARAHDLRLDLPRETPATPWGSDRSLTLESRVGEPSAAAPVKPVVAGLMSAVIPGAGQLKLGQSRGWIYLGLDVVAWFAHFALNASGDQGVRDYQRYALEHWDEYRYENTATCGDGLGPVDLDRESNILKDLYENDRDLWFAEIGDQDVYACGWETQDERAVYNRRRNHASDLSNMASNMVYVLILNRLVSTIDAARSASVRAAESRWDLQMNWDAYGSPKLTMSIYQPLR